MRNVLVFFFLIGISGILATQVFPNTNWALSIFAPKPISNENQLAHLKVLSGEAKVIHLPNKKTRPFHDNQSNIFNNDRIVLSENAQTILEFKNGSSVWLSNGADAFIHFLPNSETFQIFLNQGQYKPQKLENLDRLQVFIGWMKWDPRLANTNAVLDLKPIDKSKITDAKLIIGEDLGEPVEATRRPVNKIEESTDQVFDRNTLSNSYLDRIIADQKEHFQNCQTNRVRAVGEVKGEVVLGLAIEPTGKISEVKILTTDIDDEIFLKCLTGVFYRIEFESFGGETIYRSYPLLFQ